MVKSGIIDVCSFDVAAKEVVRKNKGVDPVLAVAKNIFRITKGRCMGCMACVCSSKNSKDSETCKFKHVCQVRSKPCMQTQKTDMLVVANQEVIWKRL